MLIGVDYHPSFQQIAFLVEETGECSERRLNHSDGEADKFYRDLQLRGVHVQVGMEATGYSRWFERLLAELGFEVWIGDPAEIHAARVKKKKTDRKDAQLLLKLMVEDRFPRISVPSPENRSLRQLPWHRHGPAYGPRVCIDHGNSEPLPAWQAQRQLRGDDSQRGHQWWRAAAGAHQK